jgi:Rrf2 family protein
MPLVSRKGILAIAAVIDVAINAQSRPVSAKALATRHKLPPRHLEPVLQALVRDGILKGIRGPHGGYELAREHKDITAEDILRAASSAEDADEQAGPISALVSDVVRPALAEAERSFSAALGRINIEDMTKRAEAAN